MASTATSRHGGVTGAAAGHWSDSAAMREQRAEMAWRLVPATVQGNTQRVRAHIALAEWLTVLVLGLLLCLVAGVGRVLFARRRLADWNKAWRVAEPRWTRQR
jgi:membrane protein YqaA with SNARE-associated domain